MTPDEPREHEPAADADQPPQDKGWSSPTLEPPPIPEILREPRPGDPGSRPSKTAAFIGAPSSDHLDAWSLGWTVASGVIGGAIVGALIDWAAGTLPIFLLVFGLLGIGNGLYQLFRKASAMNAGPPAAGRPPGPTDPPTAPNKRGPPGSPGR